MLSVTTFGWQGRSSDERDSKYVIMYMYIKVHDTSLSFDERSRQKQTKNINFHTVGGESRKAGRYSTRVCTCGTQEENK